MLSLGRLNLFLSLTLSTLTAHAQELWRVDSRVATDPLLLRTDTSRAQVGPDGKLYVFGNFAFGSGGQALEGQLIGAVMRLDPVTGAIDRSWNMGPVAADSAPGEILFDSQRRVYVGVRIAGGDASNGILTSGRSVFRLIRLLPDGTLDTTFQSPDFASTPRFIGWAGPDRIAIAYNGTAVVSPLGGILHFAILGMQGEDLTPSPALEEHQLPPQIFASPRLDSQGRILIAGHNGGASHTAMIAVGEDGAVDPSFDPGFVINTQIRAVEVLDDGKILIGGPIITFGSNPGAHYAIARLNPDGSQDTTFNAVPRTGINNIRQMRILPDGRIVAAGERGVYRFLANGNPDSSFVGPELRFSLGYSPAPGFSMDVLPSGAVYLANVFPIQENPLRPRLVRLLPSGAIDPNFNAPTRQKLAAPKTVSVAEDGTVSAVGLFTDYGRQSAAGGRVRWAPDGTRTDPAPSGLGEIDHSDGRGMIDIALGSDGSLALASAGPPFVDSSGFAVNETITRVWDAAGDLQETFPLLPGALAHLPQGWGYLALPTAPSATTFMDLHGGAGLAVTFSGSSGVDWGAAGPTVRIPGATFGWESGRDGGMPFIRYGAVRIAHRDAQGRLLLAAPTPSGEWLSRLLPTGAIDPEFTPLLFGGYVISQTSFSSQPWETDQGNEIVRLDQTLSSLIRQVRETADGSLWVAGQFDTVAGQSRPQLVRLDANGVADPTWTLQASLGWSDPVRQPRIDATGDAGEGRIWIAGSFDLADGAAAPGVLRLLSDGTRDASVELPVHRVNLDDMPSGLAVVGDDLLFLFGPYAPLGRKWPAGVMRLQRVEEPGQSAFAWAQEHGIITLQDGGAADSDGDGLSDIVKYLIGGQIGTPTVLPQTLEPAPDNTVEIRLDTAASAVQVTARLEYSADMIHWERVDALVTVEVVGDRRIYSARIPAADSEGGYLRWVVE